MSYCYEYPRPAVTTDVALITDSAYDPKILLIQRANEPFKNHWALPGGFVDMGEDLKTAALRELQEETGITNVEISQLKTYGAVDRDPRHRTISVVYMGRVNMELPATGQDDAADARWFPLNELPRLAFDHAKIIAEAIQQL